MEMNTGLLGNCELPIKQKRLGCWGQQIVKKKLNNYYHISKKGSEIMTVKQAYEIIFGKTKDYINEEYVRNNTNQVKLRLAHHQLMQKYHPDTSKISTDIVLEISKEINAANDILKKCLTDKQYHHHGFEEKLAYDNFYKLMKEEELKKAKLYRKRLTKAINTYKYYTTISIINNIKTYYQKIKNEKNLEETFKLIIEYQNKSIELLNILEEKDKLYQKYLNKSKENALTEKEIQEISSPYYETIDNQELEQIIEKDYQEKEFISIASINKMEELLKQKEKLYMDNLSNLKDAYILIKEEEKNEIIQKAYEYFKNISKTFEEKDIIELESYLLLIKNIENNIEYCQRTHDDFSINFLFRKKDKPLFINMENYHRCMTMIYPKKDDCHEICQDLTKNQEEYKQRKIINEKNKPKKDKQKTVILEFYQEYKDNLIKTIEANFYLYKVLYEDRTNEKCSINKEVNNIYQNRTDLSIKELKELSIIIEKELNKEIIQIEKSISSNKK